MDSEYAIHQNTVPLCVIKNKQEEPSAESVGLFEMRCAMPEKRMTAVVPGVLTKSFQKPSGGL